MLYTLSMRYPIQLVFAALILAGCARSATPPVPASAGPTVPPGFRAELYAQGLSSPTALAFGPDDKLYVTQLNGAEGAGMGQVLSIGGPGAMPEVVLERLNKPTGLVWRERELYLVAGRDVLRASLGADGRLGAPIPIVRDLPFNTRSEGQIDLLPNGKLLFEASGEVQDASSGRLFTLTPGGQPEQLASGLKNAYAHALDPVSGQLFTTEIGDDAMDGQAPPEEINLVQAGADYGWPHCYGDRMPATDRGGTPARCAGTAPPLLTLPPHSTPTGLLFYDGADFPAAYRDALYVALWNGTPPQVLRVTLDRSTQPIKGSATPFVSDLKRPIDLARDPRGGMLVLDHEAGVVYRIMAE